ncbi:MAG: hypothetical protein FWD61_09875 [Phycisphaerales bacterium]|nr:hypothetical protein [Phycisphaerales bacterium]
MSANERVRLDVMRRGERGEITMSTAAELMRVSPRQAKRIRKRFKALRDAGLVHPLRGRVSNHRLPEELRQRIVKRHQERYADFGPTFAGEKVLVKMLAGGQLLMSYRDHPLSFRELPFRQAPERTRRVHVNRVPWKPAANHKWRNDPVGRPASLRRGGPTPTPVGATASPPPLPTPASDRHDAPPFMSG